MPGIRPAVLLAAYGVAGALPLFCVRWQQETLAGAFREFGIGAGIVALVLLLLQFVSSGRYGVFSRGAGIDRMMRFHQVAALAVMVLAVVHPLAFLVPLDLESLRALPTRTLSLLVAPHLASGWLTLGVLIVLTLLGILRNRLSMRYELWRAVHVIAAAVVAGGALHHAFAIGAYSSSPWLKAYWWLLSVLAFGTLAYLYVLKPFLLMRGAHHVVSNEEIGHGIRELVLEPAKGKPLNYEAGQFAWVLLDQPPLTLLDHPFSFSSAPESLPQVRLLVKARGDFTRSVHRVRRGSRAYLDGPHGNFSVTGRSGRAVALIAGGIGIAPIISILRHLLSRADPRPIGVLYGARNPSQLVHADEIRDAGSKLDLSSQFFVDEPPPDWSGGVGELTADALRQVVRGDAADCLCFVCGPTPMMLACRENLLRTGVPAQQIVFERFDYD